MPAREKAPVRNTRVAAEEQHGSLENITVPRAANLESLAVKFGIRAAAYVRGVKLVIYKVPAAFDKRRITCTESPVVYAVGYE